LPTAAVRPVSFPTTLRSPVILSFSLLIFSSHSCPSMSSNTQSLVPPRPPLSLCRLLPLPTLTLTQRNSGSTCPSTGR
jgi:hypothetical protein